MPSLFCFASRNMENIWRGYRAKKWATATVKDSAMRSRIGKANKNFFPGSYGLLYCSENHAFTVPFLVKSKIDRDKVISDVWPEPWVLPFDIEPLGDPCKIIKSDLARLKWPLVEGRYKEQGGISASMNITGATVFSPVEISKEDWGLILQDLAFD